MFQEHEVQTGNSDTKKSDEADSTGTCAQPAFKQNLIVSATAVRNNTLNCASRERNVPSMLLLVSVLVRLGSDWRSASSLDDVLDMFLAVAHRACITHPTKVITSEHNI